MAPATGSQLPSSAPQISFSLSDPARRLAAVRLVTEVDLAVATEMRRQAGVWQLEVPCPDDVDRIEYLFEVEDRRGRRTTLTDPANPERAPGAFGDKSVLSLPSYRSPGWLDEEPASSTEVPFELEMTELEDRLQGILWVPDGLPEHEHAPLLVVHDGPEYARYAALTHYLGASVASGLLPPVRACLLAPGDRNLWYSANPAYATALADEVLPRIEESAPSSRRVALGASLGALSLLHAHHSRGGLFDALMLQSGSYFTPRTDPQERRFSGFGAVTRLVGEVTRSGSVADREAVPAVLTCGLSEENLSNNRAMARTLARLGYGVELVEVRDAHNFTAWRDALHPHLAALVTSTAGERVA